MKFCAVDFIAIYPNSPRLVRNRRPGIARRLLADGEIQGFCNFVNFFLLETHRRHNFNSSITAYLFRFYFCIYVCYLQIKIYLYLLTAESYFMTQMTRSGVSMQVHFEVPIVRKMSFGAVIHKYLKYFWPLRKNRAKTKRSNNF
jgi:hypothetical protein